MATKDIASISENIQQQVSAFQADDETQRQILLQSARNLVKALEPPSERIGRMCYLDPLLFAATRVLLDLDVCQQLTAAETPMSASQLAETKGADPKLVERLLKHVCTEAFVQETGPDEYVANDSTRLIASPEGQGVIKDMFQIFKVGAAFPDFLKETKYANPTNKDVSAWKHSMGTTQHYFEYIFTPGREHMAEAFHNHMNFKTSSVKWHDSPELRSALFGYVSKSEKDVLIVDMGGSNGRDLVDFRKARPGQKGRLILQDLPATIEGTDTNALAAQGVEATAHDFFTPQPIKGAKAYYLKMVLHDWPDEQCRQILSNIKPALKAGHSRILLNEVVVPETGAQWYETSLDVLMMTVHSAQERREREWRALVESVGGLKVNKIWTVKGAVEKVIEIELA